MPGVFDMLRTRSEADRVRALDRDGKAFEMDLDGLLAVCVQHEIDHLEGKLFVDYLSELKRNRIRKKLEKERRERAGRQRERKREFRQFDGAAAHRLRRHARSSRCRRSRRCTPPGHSIVAVYTQPDRPAGRGRGLTASAVKQRALELGLPVEQPVSLKDRCRTGATRHVRTGSSWSWSLTGCCCRRPCWTFRRSVA